MVETAEIIPTSTELADVIYFGGDILTMEGESPTYVEALAVKEGKILLLGSKSDVEKTRDDSTRMVDLEGKTLLPGFVDGHSHIFLYVATLDFADLNPPPVGSVQSIPDILHALEAKKEELKLGDADWVIGWGYDPDFLAEHRHPTAADLDPVFPINPVLLLHVSGHMAVANSAAMRAKNVTAQTKDPSGGVIVRNPGTQEPQGLFEEAAAQVFFMDELTGQEPVEGAAEKLQRAQAYYASHGITTAQEGAMTSEQMEVAEYAAERGQLFLDLVGLVFQPFAEKKLDTIPWSVYRNGLRYAGLKLVVDGSPQGKTAYLSQPYLTPVPGCKENCCGAPDLTQDHVNDLFLKCYQRRIQVYSHCNGDASIDMMIASHQYAIQHLPDQTVDRRTVIVHSQIMRPEQLAVYVRYGLFASFFTNHTYYWGDVHLKNLGEERASFISPMHSALKLGIRVANHTDFTVTPLNQMFVVWSAVNRLTRSGRVLGPDERISPYQALQAITIGSAFMCFEEDSKGSLRAGKLADLVVLDKNPLKVNPIAIKDIQVVSTIKGGREVFRRTAG
jgi:predicted amidohydrolase YtcJ